MEDEKLLISFLNLRREYKCIQFKLDNNIEEALNKFEKVLSTSDRVQINWLKDRYMSEFTQIKYCISQFPELRSIQDKIFTKHLQFNKKNPTYITYIFEKFIKGITYFKKEYEPVVPIYHRLYSCGPYEDTYRLGNLVCTYNLSRAQLNKRKALIERCYIERLIYNELFVHESLYFPEKGFDEHNQDEGHLFRMDLTLKDFQTCFPNTIIKVKIDYEDSFPYKLEIFKNDTKLIYIKSYVINPHGGKEYNDLVDCIKEENGKKYMKTSLFDLQSKFIEIK